MVKGSVKQIAGCHDVQVRGPRRAAARLYYFIETARSARVLFDSALKVDYYRYLYYIYNSSYQYEFQSISSLHFDVPVTKMLGVT